MSTCGLFIAGTDTGVGKTRVTVGLLQALRRLGVRAAGMKPVASGTGADGRNEDVTLICAASALANQDSNPYCFEWPISPHLAARRAGVAIEPAHIVAACARLTMHCEALLVEGTGGWLAPIGEHRTMADVAVALALPVVLVVGVRLGCLNHALLTARAVAAAGLPLAGWIGSVIEPHMQALDENIATLEQLLPAPRLGLLGFDTARALDAAQLADAAATLAAGPTTGAAAQVSP